MKRNDHAVPELLTKYVELLTTSLYKRENDHGIRREIYICRVPERLRKLKEDAYDPRLVSFGPFHIEKGNLAPMIQHKFSYSQSLIRQYENVFDEVYEKQWEGVTKSIRRDVEDLIGGCYSEKSKYDKITFMLLEGCFILGLFLRSPNLKYMTPQEREFDPVINSAWKIRSLWQDLALLENQIPFFILESLYDILKPGVKSKLEQPQSLTSLALSFFKPMMSQKSNIENQSYTDCKHLLDLLHKSTLLAASRVGTDFEGRHAVDCLAPGNQYWGFEYCASELVQSGIELCKESDDSLVNITFMRDGGLIKIPPVFIDETRESIIRNLIAYEQSSISTSQHVTSYAFLMKTLIRTPRDVKLLRKKGIISQNWIEDEEFVTQFKSLLEGVVPKDFYFGDLCEEVNAYASKFSFRRKMHSLYRTYFSTAWSMMSFIAAICLFILTVIQTYFAINPR